jgi:hypothetical protein
MRKAFNALLATYADDTLINRLNKQLIAVFATIPKTFAGNKQLLQGNVALLKGFSFKRLRRLDSLLYRYPSFTLGLNELQLVFEPLAATAFFKPFAKATAAVIELKVFNMDLNGNTDETIDIKPLVVPIGSEFKGAKLNVPLVLAGDRLVLVAVCINYRNGKSAMGGAKASAGEIVFAMKLKDGLEVPFVAPNLTVAQVEEKGAGLEWEMGV